MKKVKKRIRIKNVIIFIVIIITISLTVFLYLNRRITNIFVKGNKYLTEQEVIDTAGIKYYPKRKDYSKYKIIDNLIANPLIKEVKVSVSIFGSVLIDITENYPLVYNSLNNKYLLDNGQEVSIDKNINGVPILINSIDQEVHSNFVKAFKKIDKGILTKISEVKYDKTELDNERFLLLMNDQRYVYVTLTKITNINNYNDIVESLDNKMGILYLDSGNHFVVKDNKQ